MREEGKLPRTLGIKNSLSSHSWYHDIYRKDASYEDSHRQRWWLYPAPSKDKGHTLAHGSVPVAVSLLLESWAILLGLETIQTSLFTKLSKSR